MKKLFAKVDKKFPKGYTGKAVKLYFIVLAVSVLLYLLYPLIPSLKICLTMYQKPLCAPVGIISALVVSVPGYFLVGNLMPFLANLHWGVSLFFVVLVSAVFFAGIGRLIDTYIASKTKNKSVLLVILLFIGLVLAFLGLLLVV